MDLRIIGHQLQKAFWRSKDSAAASLSADVNVILGGDPNGSI
jgi:hypothetical protein